MSSPGHLDCPGAPAAVGLGLIGMDIRDAKETSGSIGASG
jgi:hypothetical protein